MLALVTVAALPSCPHPWNRWWRGLGKRWQPEKRRLRDAKVIQLQIVEYFIVFPQISTQKFFGGPFLLRHNCWFPLTKHQHSPAGRPVAQGFDLVQTNLSRQNAGGVIVRPDGVLLVAAVSMAGGQGLHILGSVGAFL